MLQFVQQFLCQLQFVNLYPTMAIYDFYGSHVTYLDIFSYVS